jgi:hypothetical protein
MTNIASQTSGTKFEIDGFETQNMCWRVLYLFPVAKKFSIISSFNRAGIASLKTVLHFWMRGEIISSKL